MKRPLPTFFRTTIDPDTKFLTHLNVSPFIDVIGKTITNVNSVALATINKKFGAGSAQFNGSNYLTLADNDDWYFGSGNFTIDYQLYVTSDSNFAINQKSNDNNYWVVAYNRTAGHTLRLYFVSGGTTLAGYTCPFTPSLSTWYHIAFVRNGANALIFIDGISQSLTTDVSFGVGTMPNYAVDLTIGQDNFGSYYTGNIDELRISKDIARWTSNFTPPTSEY